MSKTSPLYIGSNCVTPTSQPAQPSGSTAASSSSNQGTADSPSADSFASSKKTASGPALTVPAPPAAQSNETRGEEPGPIVGAAHEYVLHGYEGLHRLHQLVDISRNPHNPNTYIPFKRPTPEFLAQHWDNMKAATKGFTALAAVAGGAVAIDAIRRKDWAEAGDGAAHALEAGAVMGAGAIQKNADRIAAKLPSAVGKDVVRAAVGGLGRAVAGLGIVGSISHAIHNFEHAKESGHKLMWLATAADIVGTAGGIAAMFAPEGALLLMGAKLATGGMVADIGSVLADNLFNKDEKSDEDKAKGTKEEKVSSPVKGAPAAEADDGEK